jgi:hypothetical protein
MYVALTRISKYASVKSLRRYYHEYTIEPNEAIGIAYETIIGDAKNALRSVRPPTARSLADEARSARIGH